MGVYQSATEPKVSIRTVKQIVPGNIVDSMGKRKLIKMFQREYSIPRKVQPDQALVSGGWEFSFRWFEVETFN